MAKLFFPQNSRISLLNKEEYRRFPLRFEYETDGYYEIIRDPNELFTIRLVRKSFSSPINKDFISHLYDDHLENPSAYAFTYQDQIIGYLEIDRYQWNNRLRLTELLILPEFRGQGAGTRLMDHAKQIAEEEHFREIVLETQTCNTKAIDFYLKHGFSVHGIDLSSYTNDDIENKEVRLEMVYRQKGDIF